ncbi:DUF2147 domain-containing protein [Methylobacterium crusticola]|uniref:DUF2147 domain-containing protein n=1 Tax=Methylobacterium crusticola TaxID=1697972 RepID=UPI000FFBE5D5|nr:DUF2147 domain-containing protein [Methylobacterium crusticola]
MAVAILTAGPSIEHAAAQTSSPRDIVGVWAEDEGQLKFEVFEVGEGYEARIIHSSRVMEADGRTFKADTLNPDPALRSRSLEGTVLLSGLTWSPEHRRWERGNLYDGSSGRTYSAHVSLVDGHMELRGYLGVPLLGQTVILRRVQ